MIYTVQIIGTYLNRALVPSIVLVVGLIDQKPYLESTACMLNKRSTETSSVLPLRMGLSESLVAVVTQVSRALIQLTHGLALLIVVLVTKEQVIDRSATFEQVLIFMVILHVH